MFRDFLAMGKGAWLAIVSVVGAIAVLLGSLADIKGNWGKLFGSAQERRVEIKHARIVTFRPWTYETGGRLTGKEGWTKPDAKRVQATPQEVWRHQFSVETIASNPSAVKAENCQIFWKSEGFRDTGGVVITVEPRNYARVFALEPYADRILNVVFLLNPLNYPGSGEIDIECDDIVSNPSPLTLPSKWLAPS